MHDLSQTIVAPAASSAAPSKRPPPGGSGESIHASANLLDMLSPEDRAHLFAFGKPRVVEAGEELVRQGSRGDCLFIVEDGEVAVVRCLPGDDEEILLVARAGMLLGELAILDHGSRAASLRALRRSVLRVIALGAFEALTLYGGPAGYRILRAFAESVHERLRTTRRMAAARVAPLAPPAHPGPDLPWSPPPGDIARVLGLLPPFEAMDHADVAAMVSQMETTDLARGSQLVLPESTRPGVVLVLRGALSPWLDDARGPETTLPAVGPGGFVDYAAALGFRDEPGRWRARSPTRLLRLAPSLFDAEAEPSSRLLYALARDLATTIRRATGLSMHFGMTWR